MLFVPLWDMNPVKRVRFQYVTVGLIIANCVIFAFFQNGMISPSGAMLPIDFSIIPNELLRFAQIPPGTELVPEAAQRAPQGLILPEELTLVTYMFLHGSWLHLLGNMIFLWVFGDNVEDCMGHMRFLAFYLLCGIFAGLVHAMISLPSDIPMIGASGAVAGVISAYLMLHPRVRVWVLVMMRVPLRVSAGFALAVWILLQIVSVYFDADGNTAWWAHIGGLIAGAVLIIFMRKPGVPLFDKATGLTPAS